MGWEDYVPSVLVDTVITFAKADVAIIVDRLLVDNILL